MPLLTMPKTHVLGLTLLAKHRLFDFYRPSSATQFNFAVENFQGAGVSKSFVGLVKRPQEDDIQPV